MKTFDTSTVEEHIPSLLCQKNDERKNTNFYINVPSHMDQIIDFEYHMAIQKWLGLI